MAEFALGLTKTAVEGTLSLVKSAIEEEKKLREKVQNDLVFITGEFEVMQSFLHVANRERAANDKVALTLVRQLRTLAFDVEDCVEYIVHLDLDKSSRWGWLQRLWQTVNCRAPPLPLDVAVAEIKQLKARVEDVSQRNACYSLILHGSDNSNKQQQQQPVTIMPLPAEEQPAAFHVLCDAWEATGKWRSNMCNLQELIIPREDKDDLQVISVWASTGVDNLGTASIIRKAYCDTKICKKFTNRAWVKLTHPFNHHEFVKSLLTQFRAMTTSHQANAEFTEDDNFTRADKAMIMQHMREQRYLLVLEDVLTVEEWDVITRYLPDNKNGSQIIVSTTQLGIALLCTGEPYQVSELRHFSGGQFLCAFFKKMHSYLDYFKSQLRRRPGVPNPTVISVWGAGYDKSKLVDILYKGIINGLKEFDGMEFGRHSWVDVPNNDPLDLFPERKKDPLDFKVFAQRLFLNFYSDDIRASEIMEVGDGEEGEAGLIIDLCRRFLFEERCLVVINGVRSVDEWNRIESNFLVPSPSSSKASLRKTKACIIVVTDDQAVATHCVKDHRAVFNVQDLKADTAIDSLINKGTWYCRLERNKKKGRLFYDRQLLDAREWERKFGNDVSYYTENGKLGP